MTSWQRIGIVASVIWIVGFPIYVVINSNLQAHAEYRSCVDRLSKDAVNITMSGGSVPDWLKDPGHLCSETATFLSAADFGRFLIDGSSFSLFIWATMLMPVAMLWILGSIFFILFRWIK